MKLDRFPVYYSPDMAADSECFSPSAEKPAAVIDRWQHLGMPIEIFPPEPVSVEQLKLAHRPAMVDDILALKRENGFGNWSPEVARTLPLTSGAMLSAARTAMKTGLVAIAPVSGFHHAGFNVCGGYCTFNGLIVTAQVLLAAGEARQVGILDFDHHYGDGTQDCIKALRLQHKVIHFSAGRIYRYPEQATEFLHKIPIFVDLMRACDVLLYQAGADPHIQDPLGGWLDDNQLFERDRIVFRQARALQIPVAWNLAGGYQFPIEKVLRIHDNTLRACSEVYL